MVDRVPGCVPGLFDRVPDLVVARPRHPRRGLRLAAPWFVELVPVDNVAAYSSGAWVVNLIVYAVMNVFVGPFVEELYFRGYLLPRMSQMGRRAPLVNSVLFSLYHFWSPWSLLTRVVGVTPLAYAVWWKRNIYLGMAVHMLLNGLSTTFLIVTVAGKLA